MANNPLEIENDNNIERSNGPKVWPANWGLRLKTPASRDYSHLHTTLEDVVMIQHTLKKGIQLFGQAGVEAVLKDSSNYTTGTCWSQNMRMPFPHKTGRERYNT
jgi:hypothetical protein